MFLHIFHIRTRVRDQYYIDTIVSPAEVLDIIGNPSLRSVFDTTEVLSLINMCGEGISVSLEEWSFMYTPLSFFPNRLTSFLFDTETTSGVRGVPPALQPLMIDFVEWMLHNHPLEGNIRICNKLLSLLKQCDSAVHKRITLLAAEVLRQIESKATSVYQQMLTKIDMKDMVSSIHKISESKTHKLKDLKQTSLTGIPPWYKNADDLVDQAIIVRLLLHSDGLLDWSLLPTIAAMSSQDPKTATSAQHQIVAFLKNTFFAEYILL